MPQVPGVFDQARKATLAATDEERKLAVCDNGEIVVPRGLRLAGLSGEESGPARDYCARPVRRAGPGRKALSEFMGVLPRLDGSDEKKIAMGVGKWKRRRDRDPFHLKVEC
jgi:hypothetical protein